MRKANLGQSVAEYFIIMTVILTAILATGFIDRISAVFSTYFSKAAVAIAPVVKGF